MKSEYSVRLSPFFMFLVYGIAARFLSLRFSRSVSPLYLIPFPPITGVTLLFPLVPPCFLLLPLVHPLVLRSGFVSSGLCDRQRFSRPPVSRPDFAPLPSLLLRFLRSSFLWPSFPFRLHPLGLRPSSVPSSAPSRHRLRTAAFAPRDSSARVIRSRDGCATRG